MTITAVKKSGSAGSAAWAKMAVLGVVATAAITGAAPAGADTFSDGCVYVRLFEHANFGGKMTQQNPNRESLGGDWWNYQASSVAANK